MKTPEGEVKMAVLGDSPGTEEYLQHLNAFLRMLTRKKYEDEMTKIIQCCSIYYSPREEARKNPKR